jgi:phospho-N-acetylmuramoyl-pentapeptide-transferase
MARVLIAGLIAMVIAVAVGPYFIAWLKRQSIGQQIREEGPVGHVVKAGTPTMGGLLILVAALIPALAV